MTNLGAPDMHPERDSLVRLLGALEASGDPADRPGALRKSIRQCRSALAWIEQREFGLRSYSWGPRGVARINAITLGVLSILSLAGGTKPFALWRLAAQLGVWLVFGVGGGAWIGWVQWRASEENYHKQLALAGALPPPPRV